MMKNKMVNKSFFALVMILLLACIMPGESISIVLQAAPRTTSAEVGNGETDDEEEEEEIQVESVSFTNKKLTLGVKTTYQLSPTILPKNATNKDVKWKSSKKSVATVSKDGTIKAKKKGTTTITCTAKDGSGRKATCEITVKKIKFSARTKRPSGKSKHYYSAQNIYYNYDQYAPTKNEYAEGKYCAGNCTWYACGRASEILTKANKKVDLSIFGPNPVGIWNRNIATGAYPYGSTPKVGALVVFGLRYGNYHIAVVEKIVGDKIYVSESGYKTVSVVPKASNVVFHYGLIEEWNYNREIIGYIYLI